MTTNRTISADPHREELFKKLMETAPKGMSFSEMLGNLAQNYLREEHGMVTTPNIVDDYEDWQLYAHDCNQEEFGKLINFTTRLVNTVKRNECLIRKE